MRITIDASVILKWYLQTPAETDLLPAKNLLIAIGTDSVELVQPVHTLAEVAAVLTRERPGNVSEDFADVSRIINVDTIVDTEAIYYRAIRLAHELKHHLFDTLYHAVAFEREATLITADERYYRKAVRHGKIVLLGNFAVVHNA